jgi:hypothetical protein
MQPLIDLLKQTYGETFRAAIFSARFKEVGDGVDPSITLDFPKDEMERQGYKYSADYEPCKVCGYGKS